MCVFWAHVSFSFLQDLELPGKDEDTVRKYIQTQEHEDQRLEQLNLFE